MLEKKSKKIFVDAHFHYSDCLAKNCLPDSENSNQYFGCSCAASQEEWKNQLLGTPNIIKAFGIHPLFVSGSELKNDLSFLENLLQNFHNPVGECGFDFYNKPDENIKKLQEEAWETQLKLAIEYKVPLIIHCRKANEKIFQYAMELKKLPAVLFHSFMGNSIEAFSLLNKGINVFFSFNKQLMNGNKKAIDCCLNLPLDRILCETDAPFQFLKNEQMTLCSDIEKIYDAMFQLRKNKESLDFTWDDFSACMINNFKSIFGNYVKL